MEIAVGIVFLAILCGIVFLALAIIGYSLYRKRKARSRYRFRKY